VTNDPISLQASCCQFCLCCLVISLLWALGGFADSETTNTLVNFLKSRLGNDYQEEAALPEEAALREEAALGSEAYAEDVCVAV
jgi:hypothetical protein